MQPLKERLDNGEMIILDGAIGTELQRMGVPMHQKAWCGIALRDYADTVTQLHQSYIRAGADVITVNTFSSARYVLEGTDMEPQSRELNAKAVRLAIEARDSIAPDYDVHVAGVLSKFGLPGNYTDKQMLDAYNEQAEIQAEAGIDLMVLEFLSDQLEPIVAAAEAAANIDVPHWVAVSTAVGTDGSTVYIGGRGYPSSPIERDSGVLLSDAIGPAMSYGGDALLILHSEVEDTGPALAICRDHWDGALGAYSHSGDWTTPNWIFVNMISPEGYLAESNRWVQDYNIQIIGGCCGIGLQHVELLKTDIAAPA